MTCPYCKRGELIGRWKDIDGQELLDFSCGASRVGDVWLRSDWCRQHDQAHQGTQAQPKAEL